MRTIFVILFFSLNLPAQIIPQASVDALKSHITYLGNDTLQGRGSGSPGLQKAALYISEKLNLFGLKPRGHNNGWFQKVPMHGTRVLASSTLQIYFNNKNQYLLYGKDFLVIKSGGEVLNPGLLPVVFVGYGIDAPEFNYNDYRDLDVNGKIVVFWDGEPVSDNPDVFGGETNTIYALAESKIRTAIAHGAAGSIIIHNLGAAGYGTWAKKRSEYAFEEVTLPGRVTGHMALYLNSEKAELLFQGSHKTYKEMLTEKAENSFSRFELKTKIAFNGVFKQREFKSENIVAAIEGRDGLLKSDYLLLGAHYDHLGIGETMDGDSVYNGVMDNAVGCAVLLELAQMYAQADFKPRRSLLFLFFTGEEKGLLGSEYYVQHPQVAIKNSIAMINIDGLSAWGKFQSLIGVGGMYSSLGRSLFAVADEYGLSIETLLPASFDIPFSKSDQMSFAQAGIPAIQVIEGYQYADISRKEAIQRTQNWFNAYYHSPYDDLKQDISYESIARYTNFMFIFINRLLNQQDDPEWYRDSPYQRIQDVQ